jgi:transposase
MQLHTIGVDLGKTVFHLVGLNPRGEVVVRKKFSRKQLLLFTANLEVELIGMEACGGSHFLGRALREQGHGLDALEQVSEWVLEWRIGSRLKPQSEDQSEINLRET